MMKIYVRLESPAFTVFVHQAMLHHVLTARTVVQAQYVSQVHN